MKYRIYLSHLPDEVQRVAIDMIAPCDVEDTDDEASVKHRQWITRLLRIPFGVYHAPDPSRSAATCLQAVRRGLDSAVFGNDKAKHKILELVAQQLGNPGAPPQCIGLVGPPGVGKTTLVREGVASCIRSSPSDFVHISLGGSCSSDSAQLLGYGFTYEGAIHGAIADGLMRSRCMNPIFLFDEADKISEGAHGREVGSVLIHLLDPQQNGCFHDRYFQGVDLDISRAFVFLSLNDAAALDPVLANRIEFVHIDPPTRADKVQIARIHLLPRCLKEVNFKEGDIRVPDEVLEHIIDRGEKEPGVRSLIRALKACVLKLNLLAMLQKEGGRCAANSLVSKEILAALPGKTGRIKLPFTLSTRLVDCLLADHWSKVTSGPPTGMYM